jgi:hypothetical protein
MEHAFKIIREARAGVVVSEDALHAGSERARKILGVFDPTVLKRLASARTDEGGFTEDGDVYRCLYNLVFLSAIQAAFPATSGFISTRAIESDLFSTVHNSGMTIIWPKKSTRDFAHGAFPDETIGSPDAHEKEVLICLCSKKRVARRRCFRAQGQGRLSVERGPWV